MNYLFDIPTDKGNNPSSDVTKILYEAKADWQQDGHGITGPQRVVRMDPVTPYPMDFGPGSYGSFPKSPDDKGPKEDCKPPGGDTTKTYVRATHFVGGKWVCFWKVCT